MLPHSIQIWPSGKRLIWCSQFDARTLIINVISLRQQFWNLYKSELVKMNKKYRHIPARWLLELTGNPQTLLLIYNNFITGSFQVAPITLWVWFEHWRFFRKEYFLSKAAPKYFLIIKNIFPNFYCTYHSRYPFPTALFNFLLGNCTSFV